MARTRTASAGSLAAAAALLSGCTPAARQDAAGAVAAEFLRSVGSQDVAACALLAPGTRREVEAQSRSSCAAGLGGLVRAGELSPEGAPAGSVDVYSSQARAVFDGDTVFLARFGDAWLVTAAGCEPREGLPYDCALKGG